MKQRTGIPPDVAADVLFRSDRMCCVCRNRGRPVQIHQLDENPSNHSPDNLAVLCFDCHRDTQVKGGFDRKLEAQQIVLYRNDWYDHVGRRRAAVVTGARPEAPHEAVKRERGSPSHSTAIVNFVNTLPDQRRAAYAQAQQGWDTGVTAEMMNASYGLVHNLQTYLVGLASFYPRGHFGASGADEYFHEATRSRFKWHHEHLEPDGPGAGGAIVGPIAADNVIADLEDMVVELVRSLTQHLEDFNFTVWLERWHGAA